MALPAGRIGRPHGLDGSFHVVEPRPQLLTHGMPVLVAGRAAEIVARKGTDARPVVRLSVASTRDAAEALRGTVIVVQEAHAPALGEDEYWAEQLEGCTVADGGRELGVVRRLVALPSCEALELETGMLVPLVRDAVRSIDVDARRIEVDGGFLGAA